MSHWSKHTSDHLMTYWTRGPTNAPGMVGDVKEVRSMVHNRFIPRKATQFAVLAICALAATACGDGGSAAAQQSASTKIGFAQANFGNGWYEVQAEGVKDEMRNLGFDGSVVSGGGKPATQNSQIRTFITQNVKGIVMNPTDPRAVGPSVTALKQANIPLVLVNASLDESLAGNAYCHVAEDEVKNSSLIGAEMAKVLVKKKGSDTSVKALLVEGFPGDSNSARRKQGFLEGYGSVPDAPKLDFLPSVYGHFNADGAVAPVRSIATANPDLEALFVVTDSMIPGVKTALEGAGMWDKVVVGGYDARMSIVEEMKNAPDGPIVATVANSPHDQGAVGVQMLKKALDGVPQEEACPGGEFYLPPTLVTPETAAKYYKADAPY